MGEVEKGVESRWGEYGGCVWWVIRRSGEPREGGGVEEEFAQSRVGLGVVMPRAGGEGLRRSSSASVVFAPTQPRQSDPPFEVTKESYP